MPRLAVVQAAGAAPFWRLMHEGGDFVSVPEPETLATAIRIGDPVPGRRRCAEVRATNGVVEKVTEQEIADAKAQIGRAGIGCEPASAATLAGIRKLTASGVIGRADRVVAVLTGNVLKDPDYIYKYHTGQLRGPNNETIRPTFGNRPEVAPNDADGIAALLGE